MTGWVWRRSPILMWATVPIFIGGRTRLIRLPLVSDGEFYQRVEAVKVEFFADVRAMMFDRADTDAESFGDLFAGLLIRDHFQDAVFSRRQVVDARFAFGEAGG